MDTLKSWFLQLAMWFAVFLAPIKSVMIACGVLIIADLIFGMWAAHKRKEQISSARMRDSVTKMLIYQSTIVVGYVAEKYLLGDEIPITKIAAGLIGATELKSIYENTESILNVKLFDKVIAVLGSKNKEDGKDT